MFIFDPLMLHSSSQAFITVRKSDCHSVKNFNYLFHYFKFISLFQYPRYIKWGFMGPPQCPLYSLFRCTKKSGITKDENFSMNL